MINDLMSSRSSYIMCGDISLFIIHFSATKFSERVVDSISGDNFNNLSVFFIEPYALLSLQVVVEHITHLYSCALLSSDRFWTRSVFIEHHTVQKIGNERQLTPF